MKRHACITVLLLAALAGCNDKPPADRVRASGQVEATDVKVAALVGGRLLDLRVREGDRVNAGDVIARLDTGDTELLLTRAQADREQADAQLRLLQAGSRPEDIRQAQAQVASAESDVTAMQAEVSPRRRTSIASVAPRLELRLAQTRRCSDTPRCGGCPSAGRARPCRAANRTWRIARVRGRKVAAARVSARRTQIATLQKALADATVAAPVTGFVTETLAEAVNHSAARPSSSSPISITRGPMFAWTGLDSAVARRRRRRSSPTRA
jgi:multidrug efflux pump subunit AcrA (membrane-fusion protein)